MESAGAVCHLRAWRCGMPDELLTHPHPQPQDGARADMVGRWQCLCLVNAAFLIPKRPKAAGRMCLPECRLCCPCQGLVLISAAAGFRAVRGLALESQRRGRILDSNNSNKLNQKSIYFRFATKHLPS